ncbi:MAG TPA: hypothetical protein PK358_02215 [Spirochaetota bacterium]|nr:hypothetical protein [Spirochaetota bacterium]
MKKRIIRIADVSEIDTSKISVYDLNNRYIDPIGNMFGLKYNRDTRKVEIIKLERIHSSEMLQYQRKIMVLRDIEQNQNVQNELKEKRDFETESEKIFFEPDVFIESVISDSEVHRERLAAIMMNIDLSDVFTRENKVESTALDDLSRHIEIDCIQQLDKLESYYRELVNYPRSITYYQAKVDTEGKNIIDSMGGLKKEKIMKFIFFYEMSANIKRVYNNIKKHVSAVDDFVNGKNPDEIQGIAKHQKQAFIDARTSIGNTISEVDDILAKNRKLYEYTINKNNF